MIKAEGDINKEYNNLNELQSDVFNKCLETKGMVFVNYHTENSKVKKSLIKRIFDKIKKKI